MKKFLTTGVFALAMLVALFATSVRAQGEQYWEIYFDLDQARVTPVAAATLKEVAQVLEAYPDATVNLSGHTCDLAGSSYNKKLSQRRVAAAKAFLVKQGIKARRITTEALGLAAPRYSNATAEGKMRNRRVEVLVHGLAAAPAPQSAPIAAPVPVAPGEVILSSFASVLDDSGAFVPGLGVPNFKVFQGGKERKVVNVVFEGEDNPFNMVLALDQSASMASSMNFLKQAARMFVNNKKPNDALQIVAFSSAVRAGNRFSADANELNAAIDGLQAHGYTRLYDALLESSLLLADKMPPRILLLMTDGVDEMGFGRPGSKVSLDQAINVARQAHVTVLAVGMGPRIDADVLSLMAVATDGAFFWLPNKEALQPFYDQVSRGFTRGKYRIDFASTTDDTSTIVVVESNRGHAIGLK